MRLPSKVRLCRIDLYGCVLTESKRNKKKKKEKQSKYEKEKRRKGDCTPSRGKNLRKSSFRSIERPEKSVGSPVGGAKRG